MSATGIRHDQLGSSGPLAGIEVVELAGLGPAPHACMLLADLGARVIRIERPEASEPVRRGADIVGRSRHTVVADLKSAAGRESVLALLADADVLIEGYRPGVLERLGLAPDDLLLRYPQLVVGRMTGWGQDGPWAHRAGHDINYISVTGVLHAMGRAGGPPQVPLNLVGDFGGGSTYLIIGVLAALLERQATGRGQVVDAAIVDGVASLSALLWGLKHQGHLRPDRGESVLDTGAPYYDVYETADGGWMACGAIEPQFYALLVEKLNLVSEFGECQNDPSRWTAMRQAFASVFKSKARGYWEGEFRDSDACVTPVLRWDEVRAHEHMSARGTLIEVDGLTQPRPAPRFLRSGMCDDEDGSSNK